MDYDDVPPCRLVEARVPVEPLAHADPDSGKLAEQLLSLCGRQALLHDWRREAAFSVQLDRRLAASTCKIDGPKQDSERQSEGPKATCSSIVGPHDRRNLRSTAMSAMGGKRTLARYAQHQGRAAQPRPNEGHQLQKHRESKWETGASLQGNQRPSR